MGVFWLAVDTRDNRSSYLELKYRKVVAQGWGGVGDLVSLKPFHPNHKKLFIQNIQVLGDIAYKDAYWWKNEDRNESRCPTIMHNLMGLKKGDLIIALEGRTVKGICQMPSDGLDSYRLDKGFTYAQTVGFGVKWVDWSEDRFGLPPNPPAIPFGIDRLVNERQRVIDAWNAYQNSQST